MPQDDPFKKIRERIAANKRMYADDELLKQEREGEEKNFFKRPPEEKEERMRILMEKERLETKAKRKPIIDKLESEGKIVDFRQDSDQQKFLRANLENNQKIAELRKEFDIASREGLDPGTRTAEMIEMLQSGAIPGGQDAMKIVEGLTMDDEPTLRQLGTIGSGMLGTAFKLSFPALIALEGAGTVVGKVTEKHIKDPTTRNTVNTVANLGLSGALGFRFLVGSLFSLGASETANKIMEGTELDDKDKQLIEEAGGLVGFLIGVKATKPLTKGMQKMVDKFARDYYKPIVQTTPEGELKKKGMTEEGKQYFTDRLNDPNITPNETRTIRNWLKNEGVDIDKVAPIKPVERGLQLKGKEPVEKKVAPPPVEVTPVKKPAITVDKGLKQRGEQVITKRPETKLGRDLQAGIERKRVEKPEIKKTIKQLPERKIITPPPVEKKVAPPTAKSKLQDMNDKEVKSFVQELPIKEKDGTTPTVNKVAKNLLLERDPETIRKAAANISKDKVELNARNLQLYVDAIDPKVSPEMKKLQESVKPKRKKKAQVRGSKKQDIQDRPLTEINVKPEDFQGRMETGEPFSEKSFRKVVSARLQSGIEDGEITESKAGKLIDAANKYLDKNHPSAQKMELEDLTPADPFRWSEFGQVNVWRDPADNKLYVLSGHSRLAASEFLSEHFEDFKEIPTIGTEAKTFDEAVDVAKRSNIGGTTEGTAAHAEKFRKLREKGIKAGDIVKAAKAFHGKESNRIINVSHLSRDGDMIQQLRQNPDQMEIVRAADWIGEARRSFSQLTDAHENELYRWLIKDNAMFTKIKSKVQLNDTIYKKVTHKSWDPDRPLNLKNVIERTGLMEDFEADVSEAEKKFEEAKTDLFKERGKALKRGVGEADLIKDEKVKLAQKLVDRYQKELVDLKAKRSDVLEQDTRQESMFGEEPSGVISEPGVSYNPLPGGQQQFPVVIPTETKAFKRWFGKSKITTTDEAGGEPLKMYHGTYGHDFVMFDPDAPSKVGGTAKNLIFFTPDPKTASSFAVGLASTDVDFSKLQIPGSRLYEVYIHAKNPFSYDDPNHVMELQNYFLSTRKINFIGREFKIEDDNHSLVDLETNKLEKQFFYPDLIESIARGDWSVIENNLGAFKALGYDAMWMREVGSRTLAVMDPTQIKSTTNESFRIGEPDITREKFSVYDGMRKISAQEEQVQSAAFEKWFGDSKIVDSDGSPLVVWHGTTHNIQSFDPSRANQEGHFGKVVYFTSSELDANSNYLGKGADLTGRIENLSERMLNEIEDNAEESIYWDVLTDEEAKLVKLGLQSGNPLYKMEGIEKITKRIASERLKGTGDNIIPVYLKMENPINITGYATVRGEGFGVAQQRLEIKPGYGDLKYPETMFEVGDDVDMEAATDEDLITRIADEQGIEESEVDLKEIDEHELDNHRREFALDNGYYIEPEGTLIDIMEAFRDAANDKMLNGADAMAQFQEELQKLGHETFGDAFVPAHVVDAALRNVPELLDAFDAVDLETGGSLMSEIIRDAYERAGYDGIVLTDADKQFTNMKMDEGTIHYHAFEPSQIKSAIGNNGEFDPNSVDIIRENMDPFKRKVEGSKDENELQRLKDYKNHLSLAFKQLVGKEGNMVLGRDRYGVKTISYPLRRAQITKEIDDITSKIDALEKKIPKKVKLENQVDMFGLDVKEPATNEQLIDDLMLQRDKINDAVGDALTSIDYWESELKDEIVITQQDLKTKNVLRDHVTKRLAEHKASLTDLNNQLKNVNRKIRDIDGGKALDERDLKDKLKEQHQDLKSNVEITRAAHDQVLAEIDAAGLFGDVDLQEKLARAKDRHLDNIAALETFLGKNTNLYDTPEKPEDGDLFVREQLALDFATRKIAIAVGVNTRYKGDKAISAGINQENPGLRKLEKGEEANIETMYKKFGQIKFYGKGKKAKIETVEDVVYMFKQLENEAVEHAFVVHVSPKGNVIQHLSTGNINSSIVDPKAFLDLSSKLGTTEMYFVHNHPSGNLEASAEDMNVLSKIKSMYANKEIRVHDGVIINIRDGKFAMFSRGTSARADLVNMMKGNIESVELPAITFSRNVFRKPMTFDAHNKITSPDDVAVIISQERFGLGEKTQVLILNSGNQVVGRVFAKNKWSSTPGSVFQDKDVWNEIAVYQQRFGGAGVVVVTNKADYSNFHEGSMAVTSTGATFQNIEDKFGVRVVDFIGVEPINDKDLRGYSTAGGGQIIRVGEPSAPYKRITPASKKVMEPGSDDFRSEQDRPRLDAYIKRVEESLPSKMDPVRAERLTELEGMKTLTPEQTVERNNLRKEKKGFAALDPLLRRRLSTDIKNRIKAIRTGYKVGSQEREKQLAELKKDLNSYARLFLPKGNFLKSEVTGLMSAVAKAKDYTTLTAAFGKIRKVEERVRRRRIFADYSKLLKSTSLEKGDPQFVTWIKQINKMTPQQVDAEIETVLNNTAGKGEEFTDKQDEYFYLLNKYSDIKNKSTDDLEQLYLELSADMEAGRSKRKAWLNQEKLRRKDMVNNAVTVITGGKGVLDPDEARLAGLDKPVKSAGDMLSNLGTMTHSWEMILDKLSKRDPSDPFRSWLNEKFAVGVHKARTKEGAGVRNAMDVVRNKLMEIFGTSNKRRLISEMDENSIRQLTGATRIKITEYDEAGVPSETKKVELTLSQNEAAHVLMAYEDPKLLPMFERMGIGLETIEALRKFIKPTVMKWAKWQLEEFYPTYYPDVNEVYKQIRGVELPFNPKYMPIRKEVSANMTDKEFLGDVTEFVSMINGSLLARIANTRPLKIQDIDRVLLEHIITMEHFKAFAPVMQDMRAVFNSHPVRQAISQYHGATMLKVINRFMNDFARGGVDRKNSVEIMDKIRANFIRSVIGVNPVVTIKQLTSFPAFAMDIPVKDFMIGIAQFAGNPIPKIKFLLKNSEMLRTRYHKGWERDIILAMSRARKTTSKELARKFTFTDAAMMFTKFGDGAAILFGGWGVYNYWNRKLIKQGVPKQQAHERAMLEFEMSAKRAQQAGDVEDLGELQRQGSWQKMFTIFMTAPKQYFSNASAAYRNILYKRGSNANNIKRLAIAHFILPMLFQFSADGFRWDKDHMLRAALLGSLNGILILGDMMEFIFSAFQGDTFWDFDETPLGSIMGDTKIAIDKINKLTDSNGWYLDEILETADAVADATSKPFGIPYQPVKKLAQGIQDFSDAPDDESFLRLFGYSKTVFEEEPAVDPMVEEIQNDEKRLKKLKGKAREMPTIKALVDEAKEFERVLILKKKNSPEWKKYRNELKDEGKEKRKNDPFAKPKKQKQKFKLAPGKPRL